MEYRKVNQNAKIAYNGIEGSFSHEVALLLFGKDAILKPAPELRRLESGLVRGDYDIGIIAAVNSGGGPVKPHLDTLLHWRGELQIVDHFGMLVDQRIGGFCKPEDVRYIASHPTAIAQCQDTLYNRFQDFEPVHEEDTALAIKKLARDYRPNNGQERNYDPQTAVIGSKVAFELYGVPMFEPQENIADEGDSNITAFLWIERRKIIPSSLTKEAALKFGITIGE